MPFNCEHPETLNKDLQSIMGSVAEIAIDPPNVLIMFPLDMQPSEHPEFGIVVSALLFGPQQTQSVLDAVAVTIHEVIRDFVHKCVMESQRVRITVRAADKHLEAPFEADIPFEMKNLVQK
jgi:hypothetical protein